MIVTFTQTYLKELYTDGKASDNSMIANNLTSFYLTHPGEVLKDEVEARGISQKALAENIGLSYKILNDILNERRLSP